MCQRIPRSMLIHLSVKTAEVKPPVICSELFPQVVWLASGGLTMLNPAITRQ